MTTNKKNIWIINQYAGTPETRQGGRHYYLSQALAEKGYNVFLIMASHTHYTKGRINIKGKIKIKKAQKNLNLVWLKVPLYNNAHDKKRILNWFLFTCKLMMLKGKIANPDIILYSSPAPIGFLAAEKIAKNLQVPLAFEVRDIWPLTLMQIGGYKSTHPFIRFLGIIEKRAYKNSNLVISNLKYSVKHMTSRGMNANKFIWIPNGISKSALTTNATLPDNIFNQIPTHKFIVGYTGTLGEANAMQYLIEAAGILKQKEDIHFVLVGKGKNKKTLLAIANKLKLNNITFIDPVERNQVQSILQTFDVCYIGWHNRPLYEYGIAANKIPEYMYSGKPVINSFSGKGDLIDQSGSGITVEAENPEAISNAILQIYSMNEDERLKIGMKGKKYVLENLTYERLADKLEQALFKAKKQ